MPLVERMSHLARFELTDAELKERQRFQERLEQGETLDDLIRGLRLCARPRRLV